MTSRERSEVEAIRQTLAKMPVRIIKRKLYLCYCMDCDEYFIGERRRHVMYNCPQCKTNGVDIEEHYSRLVGNCDIIKEIKLPKKKKVKE